MRLSIYKIAIALLLVAGLGIATPTLAIGLGDAKANGYLGEQLDGYLGMVDSTAPASVQALMKDINGKRRAEYKRIAKRNNIRPTQVASRTAEKVIAKAKSGHFVQNSKGKWVKR